MRGLLSVSIRLYQRSVSLFLPPSCRFSPSCSEYMLQAIQKKGIGQGLYLGFKRILRCHPWNPGGFDPVR